MVLSALLSSVRGDGRQADRHGHPQELQDGRLGRLSAPPPEHDRVQPWVAETSAAQAYLEAPGPPRASRERELERIFNDIGRKCILPSLQEASDFLAVIEKGNAPSATGTLQAIDRQHEGQMVLCKFLRMGRQRAAAGLRPRQLKSWSHPRARSSSSGEQ